MKILVTSGGTSSPIDGVRSITNFSSGKFGSDIVSEILDCSNEARVLHLTSDKGVTPFTINCDISQYNAAELYSIIQDVVELRNKFINVYQNYRKFTYKTFEEYQSELTNILSSYLAPDIVFLAAAVSDYGVQNAQINSKLSSDSDNLTISLKKLPKLIKQVKTLAPKCILVGFKLLNNVSENELIVAGQKNIQDNNCDWVICNDLQSIKSGNHTVIMLDKNGEVKHKFSHSRHNVAREVVCAVLDEYTRLNG